MTSQSTDDRLDKVTAEGSDQNPYPFSYGHGRMPFFMKIVWVGFLIMTTWYVVTYLLEAVGQELK
ncbi:MAG TPA: hypothetical protein PKA37_02280 [Planctomycetota bacterium]|nr:hypothetical protein [Planctomycetota bacterium]